MICFAKAIVCGVITKQSCVMPDDGGDFLNVSLSKCEKTSIFYCTDGLCDASHAFRTGALGIGIAHPLR